MKDEENNINPWLAIPASDYEDHMDSAGVGQLGFLNGVFAEILTEFHPRRLIVAGCTTGNGFEHIDFNVTEKVIAIDINEEYLSILRDRFSRHHDTITTVCADIEKCDIDPHAFDLVHCALIFEYVDPHTTIRNISSWLAPGGIMSVVLQLHDDNLKPVSETPFRKLKILEPILNLVDPEELKRIAASQGMECIREEIRQLESGKRFSLSIFSNNR